MYIKDWKMDYNDHKGLSCKVPCSMYSVLYEHNIIDDPFYGLNERKYAELSDNDCIFYSEFELNEDIVSKDFTDLIFYGLDTICDIYFNDILISSVKNMHRRYIYDISNIAKKGINTIKLHFKSPTKYFKKMNARHYTFTDANCLAGAAHLRKAYCMSGWDWGPTLPDMGIFRDVEIAGYNKDRVKDIIINQEHHDNSVDLLINVSTIKDSDCEMFAEADGKTVKLENKKGKITIDNPKLWWPNGIGEQNLYDVKIYIKNNGEITDTTIKTIGLRTLYVSTESDDYGKEFCFIVNGEKIFAMGANYIPQDSLYARVNRQTTQKLIDSCVDANFNCLRVWGGGYYPSDDFYEICDRAGIMVWQDYMVACANIWLTSEMKQEFTEEAEYNLKRIAYHPSLAILCGNNEMEGGLVDWGINNELVQADYIELFERLLPEISYKYAPNTFYWPSSPSSGGGLADPSSDKVGDVHYWLVWHGNIPFEEYRNHKFRFCSEYGFESFPNIKTIKSFCEEKNMNAFSRVVENHQKCKSGNTKILTYLSDKYLYPTSFENLVYASQLLQAEAIRLGVEHFRRIRGCCMGSIYWQFNDCWPVASWSSVDYFGRYKALHYEAKKFYAPVACGIFNEKGKITVNVANETLSEKNVILKWGIVKNNLDTVVSGEKKATLKKLSSCDIFTVDINELDIDIYSDLYYVDLYDGNGNFIMRRSELFTVPKYFEWQQPEIKIAASENNGIITFKVSSDKFAKGIEIDFANHDVILSDNYFDITDKNEYIITCKTDIPLKELTKDITIKSVYDIK